MRICPICGNPFNKRSKYCSAQCQHISMRTYNYDINNPPHCKHCDVVLTHRLANTGASFCSWDCRIQYLDKLQLEKLNSVRGKVCEVCHKPLTDKQCLANTRTCSAKCAYELRVRLYGDVSEANPDKFVQYKINNELRKDKDYCESRSERLKTLWNDSAFRESVVKRMTYNNPVYKEGVIEKSNRTKEQHGILHTWVGTRGGNGKISECEALIYDFCIANGFLYNKAISTNSLRKQYPDKHFAVNYKPDFTNLEAKLCIEVDGSNHYTTEGRRLDAKKEFCLNTLGYTILRFSNEEIKSNLEDVKRTILSKLYEMGYQNGKT